MENTKNNSENKANNYYLKYLLMFALVCMSGFIFAQDGGGTHPGADPFPTPIDGGILMAILAVGSLGSLLLKKKKDKK